MKIIIEIEPDGQMRLTGFPTDRITAYGILKITEKALDHYFVSQSRIVKPDLGSIPPNGLQ